ncbi:hypothetical protein QVD17_07037 [Tagetes erecta]|uniref:Uncharacterized protein n=1 Tax=Tagetes erecta TaxID=13708 RepID=A0AAD8PCN5_TARER|nr:hypothetical protein QVD17_07037 [Tagetes erecta]
MFDLVFESICYLYSTGTIEEENLFNCEDERNKANGGAKLRKEDGGGGGCRYDDDGGIETNGWEWGAGLI